MSIARKSLRWNGWGLVEAPDTLGTKAEGIWRWMSAAFGVQSLQSTPAKPLESIALPPIRLSDDALARLRVLTAPERVMTDNYERAFHAKGKSYLDLLRLRAGEIDSVPDAIVYPISTEETVAVVEFAAEWNIAVVPFGGGSSVVGGVNALRGEQHAGLITLDMTQMNRVLDVDRESLVARVEAGIYGPALEEALQREGLTLSHYPQSFEYSTLGGWIAARGAGHQSNRYGKAEDWLVSATLATPNGLWTTERFPASAAGPRITDLVAGSEGVLGIITEAEIRLHPVPEVKDYRGYLFADFAAGVEAARALMQSETPPAMVRLSDAPETFFLQALHSGGETGDGEPQFCLMLVGYEGEKTYVELARSSSQVIIEKSNGMHMGESLGEGWYRGRFATPYLRDPMLDRGLGVDTLETATRWVEILPLHDAVTKAIAEALSKNPGQHGARGVVMSHLSHAYRDGASLYFTFAFARDLKNPVEQWLAIKRAASEVIATHGATISHHHGVGTDHLPWLAREKGRIGMGVLQALKHQLDPTGILNPGKLIA